MNASLCEEHLAVADRLRRLSLEALGADANGVAAADRAAADAIEQALSLQVHSDRAERERALAVLVPH
jgi:hypothetical protein